MNKHYIISILFVLQLFNIVIAQNNGTVNWKEESTKIIYDENQNATVNGVFCNNSNKTITNLYFRNITAIEGSTKDDIYSQNLDEQNIRVEIPPYTKKEVSFNVYIQNGYELRSVNLWTLRTSDGKIYNAKWNIWKKINVYLNVYYRII